MSGDRTTVVSECPFLQPGRPGAGPIGLIGVYCRFPDGRVRVPAMDEMRRFCLREQWEHCPAYERHAPAR
jgi:hypothetical protein